MRTLHQSVIICFLLLVPCMNAFAAQFAGVADKTGADLAEVVRNVERADVIFIGEIHYNALHHKAQLDIIRSLHMKKKTIAIGL